MVWQLYLNKIDFKNSWGEIKILMQNIAFSDMVSPNRDLQAILLKIRSLTPQMKEVEIGEIQETLL